MTRMITPEKLARLFHETYERLAPEFQYETRRGSAKPWDQVPDNNKRLMIATAEVVLTELYDTYDITRPFPAIVPEDGEDDPAA